MEPEAFEKPRIWQQGPPDGHSPMQGFPEKAGGDRQLSLHGPL